MTVVIFFPSKAIKGKAQLKWLVRVNVPIGFENCKASMKNTLWRLKLVGYGIFFLKMFFYKINKYGKGENCPFNVFSPWGVRVWPGWTCLWESGTDPVNSSFFLSDFHFKQFRVNKPPIMSKDEIFDSLFYSLYNRK